MITKNRELAGADYRSAQLMNKLHPRSVDDGELGDDPTELERTAYHEAGHAVFTFIAQHRCLVATIEPAGEMLGQVRWRLTAGDTPLVEMVVGLAGLAAEAHLLALRAFGPLASLQHDCEFFQIVAEHQPDLREACDLAKAVFQSSSEARLAVRKLREEIAVLLSTSSELWAAVRAVAAALVERRTIKTRHVSWVIRRAFYHSQESQAAHGLRWRMRGGRGRTSTTHATRRFRRLIISLARGYSRDEEGKLTAHLPQDSRSTDGNREAP